MTDESPRMAPSPRHQGVRKISGFRTASAGVVRVDTPGSSNRSTRERTTRDGPSSSSTFSIHFSNIRGLSSNLSSVEHHLASHLPNLFLLSETQLSSNASPDPFNISHYNLISRFRAKGGVCAYCNTNTSVARLVDLESPNFDVLWLKICLSTSTILICFCYCSPNSFDHSSFFENLTSCHESLQSSHPHSEIL